MKIKIILGGKYRHYKGKEYRVLQLATHTETQEVLVIYQALSAGGKIWARPAVMFLEDLDDSTSRFEYISEE